MRLIAIQGNTPSEIDLILLTWIGKKTGSVKNRRFLKAPNLVRWNIMKEKQCCIIYLRRIPI